VILGFRFIPVINLFDIPAIFTKRGLNTDILVVFEIYLVAFVDQIRIRENRRAFVGI